jgi:type II secretory pathway pseudopilin PulG
MLIVVTLIALVAGLSFPSVASGLESLRLRSASDSIVSLLNTALDRADRRQQAVEIMISPRENSIVARSADLGFTRRVDLQEPLHISAVLPAAEVDPAESRRFLIYPGGAVPRIGIEISNRSGRKRTVSVDPITGVPQAK